MAGSKRCKDHVCPHPGCTASKSSRAAFCKRHAAAAAGVAPAAQPVVATRQPETAATGETAAASASMPATSLAVGARVSVIGYDCPGTVRYVGPHLADPTKGDRMLVELDKPIGKNNGTVKGTRFCAELPQNAGVLVPLSKVTAAKPVHGNVLRLASDGNDNDAEEEC
eukprot:gene24527-14915_t